MKKCIRTGLLTLSLMLLAGCVGGLNVNRMPVNIGFDPVIGHDTRVEESVPFPQDRTFNVWAVKESNGDIYLDDEMVAYTGQGWLASKTWPQTGLSFEVYSPSSLNVEFTNDRGLTIKDFDCSKGEVDILIAKTGITDIDADSLVTLTFEHVLSRVEFRMIQSLAQDMHVRVKKIEMTGFASKGTYNSRDDQAWKAGAKDYSYVAFENQDGVDVTSDPVYVGSDFYAIPQLCNAKVAVTFDVKFGDAGWIEQISEIKDLDTRWKPSTHYTYTLNLTMDKLTYTTGISTWSNRDE